VQSKMCNAGFIQAKSRFVRVQVVYDERLPLDNYEGVDITGLNQEVRPKSPYELNVMRITVDGKPIDDPGRSSSTSSAALTSRSTTPRSLPLRQSGVAAAARRRGESVAVAVGDLGGVLRIGRPFPDVQQLCKL